jgi:hypothetical protein
LGKYGLLDEFEDVIEGIQHGFTLNSTKTITKTYVYDNHPSARNNRGPVNEHIEKELDNGRYFGPFTQAQLEARLGRPFISHPLGARLKSDGIKWRIIEDLSWPPYPGVKSVNDLSDHSDVPVEWGGMAEMMDRVIRAKPGTQGGILDWGDAFRQLPIRREELWMGVVQWNVEEGDPKEFYVDGNAKFGHSRSIGSFGRVNKAFVTLIKKKGIADVIYWVDDLCVIREPTNKRPPWKYESDIKDIRNFGKELGIPLPKDKIHEYSNVTPYIGFQWHWDSKKVEVPEEKKAEVREKIKALTNGQYISKDDLRSLCGSLAHLSQVVSQGKARMRGLYQMQSQMAKQERGLYPSASEDLAWWKVQLRRGHWLGMTLCTERTPDNSLGVYVDAHISGIGIIINGEYDSFALANGWQDVGDGTRREIGWAEFVAVELAVFFLTSRYNMKQKHILIHSDNQGVMGAWNAQRSSNVEWNAVLMRIIQMLGEVEGFISIEYVRSEENPADAVSRGRSPVGLRKRNFGPLPRSLQSLVLRR